jgi:hypothetical protein
VTEIENDVEAQDPPEVVSVEAIGLVEDVPIVETIGPIEDAQEMEAIGHIDDEVNLEKNGVVEEPTTGNTFSQNNPRRSVRRWLFIFLMSYCRDVLVKTFCMLSQSNWKSFNIYFSPLLSSTLGRFSYRPFACNCFHRQIASTINPKMLIFSPLNFSRMRHVYCR